MARTNRQQRAHANRTLALFTVGLILLCVLAAFGKTWAPGLGLDLRGGTRITMVAEQENPTLAQLNEAASIIASMARVLLRRRSTLRGTETWSLKCQVPTPARWLTRSSALRSCAFA